MRVGRLFAGVAFTRRWTPWVHYESRRRYDHLFSVCRIYDRDKRVYTWRLAAGPMSFGIIWTPRHWPEERKEAA